MTIAEQALERVGMTEHMQRPIAEYSRGRRQRTRLAQACAHLPELLILDEPFNGTAPRQRLQMNTMLKELGDSGRPIVFSSHILEDVEALAEDVLVVIGGRLGAAGNFRQIRRLITSRPHAFTIRSSNNRALAAALVDRPYVTLVSFDRDVMEVQPTDFGAFTESIAPLIRSSGVALQELQPADDSLESVFAYLVAR